MRGLRSSLLNASREVWPKLSTSSIAAGRPSLKPMRMRSKVVSRVRGRAAIQARPSAAPSSATSNSRSKSLAPNRIEAGLAGRLAASLRTVT